MELVHRFKPTWFRCRSTLRRTSTRRAVTLLEVMISIGIVGIGLLGVASLIPLAHFKAAQGIEEDRKGIYGKRAFREFFVYGMDRPGNVQIQMPILAQPQQLITSPYWVWYGNGVTFPATSPPPYGQLTSMPYGQVFDVTTGRVWSNRVFFIDPLWVASVNPTGPPPVNARFPFDTSNVLDNNARQLLPQRLTLLRNRPEDYRAVWSKTPVIQGAENAKLTAFYASLSNNQPPIMPRAQADEIFRLRDDLITEAPREPGEFTQQSYLTDGPLIDAKRYTNGSYSWLATVSPDDLPGSNLHRLSVVIFHQRTFTLTPRQETIADVDLNFTKLTGSYKEIVIDEKPVSTPDNDDVRISAIRPGHWLALVQIDPNGSNPPNLQNNALQVLKWYRVMTVDDIELPAGSNRIRQTVSLSGPDWNIRTDLPPGMGGFPFPMYAIYAKGVVSVYDKTVELR